MSDVALSTDLYAERISVALKKKWGNHRSCAKEIANSIGAGVGTVRKWLRGETGPSGEHLLRLVAESDEVWAAVLEMSGRVDRTDEESERMRRALAVLQGKDA